jgi:anti-sigma B factor antagonist
MFEIRRQADGTLSLHGRFDAAQVDLVTEVLDQVTASTVLDFAELKYVSSAGLGLLFATQRRLLDRGGSLTLVNLSPHIREIFLIAGFDHIFRLE